MGAVTAGLALPGANDWSEPEVLGLLFGMVLLGELFPIQTKNLFVSGSFPALVLIMALFGPGPAVLAGALGSLIIDIVRYKSDAIRALNNLCAFSVFPFVGAMAFYGAGYMGPPEGAGLGFAALVLSVFVATNLLNFVLIVAPFAIRDGISLTSRVHRVYLPTVPVGVATGLLTASVAYGYQRIGATAILLAGVVGFVFIYLLRINFRATERGEQLEERTRELASLQVGLLTTVINTLAMRDKMTARHSAAVARYSRAMARALGLDEREQDIVHTAALLHDIGKFIFPDSILLADTRLTDEEFEIVKRHPEQGAELVRGIEGYGPIADIILAHHERVDGRGYPAGLAGEQIPLAARIIAVADTYDVMTARDSYQKPVTRDDAIAELHRVAGSQLDPQVVEAFVRLLEANVVEFRHADNADFEAELNLERRVRDYARPRVAA